MSGELDRRRHVTLGLDRVRELLSLLGEPHRRLRIVQVVGTNGKGTTAVSLAAALEAAGQRAGVYLSPHVLSYTERVVLRGEPVSEETFAAAMGEAIDVADAHGVTASQFELLTAGALKLFAGEGLSWAVLEAGLGARHDATTAALPDTVVLTNVGLDHTEFLGHTVEEISAEKLASLAAGATLVLGTDDPRVVSLARKRCEEVGARLFEAAREPDRALPPGTILPPYALRDARLGMLAAEELLGRRLSRAERSRAVRAPTGALPGRFELHEVRGVPVVVDGGHNPTGVAAALEGVRGAFGERPLAVVFGALRDKDVGSMLTALKNEAHLLVLTRPDGDRGADPAGVEREYGPRDREGRPALVAEDAVRALELAVEEARASNGVALVVGSLYTAAPVLRRLREE
ncbi:MAG TPA: cyanophycin synthetase [Rubrobacteraceae bacterium]|nr:cyanophycin synthetase [Rubrobacteraceae bacterium]